MPPKIRVPVLVSKIPANKYQQCILKLSSRKQYFQHNNDLKTCVNEVIEKSTVSTMKEIEQNKKNTRGSSPKTERR